MTANPAGVDTGSDPRVTGEYIHQLSDRSGTLTLVGVVHDHPASTYRVRQAVAGIDPDVLALELPPISVPLFEEYGRTERSPPTFGGEMSAAIQAAAPGVAVGIDRPTGGFFRRLGRVLLRDRPPVGTVQDLVSTAVSTTGHAVLCRVAAGVAARTSIRVEVDSPVGHGVDHADRPEKQALDEREQVRRSRSFIEAFQSAGRFRASRLEDTVREAEMASRLTELRERGEVVAVVGIVHLEPLIERLDAAGPAA